MTVDKAKNANSIIPVFITLVLSLSACSGVRSEIVILNYHLRTPTKNGRISGKEKDAVKIAGQNGNVTQQTSQYVKKDNSRLNNGQNRDTDQQERQIGLLALKRYLLYMRKNKRVERLSKYNLAGIRLVLEKDIKKAMESFLHCARTPIIMSVESVRKNNRTVDQRLFVQENHIKALCYNNLGVCYELQGDTENAKRNYLAAWNHFPENDTISYHFQNVIEPDRRIRYYSR